MRAISYTAARSNLAKTMTKVCEDHDPVIITRQNSDSVVMLSLKDYDSLCETHYLLQNPQNARRLLTSIDELSNGKGKEQRLFE
jgi:antitoxin YefM